MFSIAALLDNQKGGGRGGATFHAWLSSHSKLCKRHGEQSQQCFCSWYAETWFKPWGRTYMEVFSVQSRPFGCGASRLWMLQHKRERQKQSQSVLPSSLEALLKDAQTRGGKHAWAKFPHSEITTRSHECIISGRKASVRRNQLKAGDRMEGLKKKIKKNNCERAADKSVWNPHLSDKMISLKSRWCGY